MLKITGTGKITTDIQNDITKNGNPWSRFLLSCSTGRGKYTTLKAVVFDQHALTSLEKLTKGNLVEFIGVLSENEWQTRNGETKRDLNIKIDNIAVFTPQQKDKQESDFDTSEPF